MERVAGFVDFGFLQKSTLKLPAAKRLQPKAEGVINWLRGIESDPSSFLRAYWYDGAYDPRHAKHIAQRTYFDALAAVPGVQLRLGHLQELKPKWQYAVQEALKNAGLDQAKFNAHFKFRPELSQKRASTQESPSISCVSPSAMLTMSAF